jgi:hypothetical protein
MSVTKTLEEARTLVNLRANIATALQLWQARDDTEMCGAQLTLAETAFTVARNIDDEKVLSGGVYVYQADPMPWYQLTLDRLDDLAYCVDTFSHTEDPGESPGTPVDPQQEEEVEPGLQSTGPSMKTLVGVVLLGLAAWGFWRMR